MTWRQEGTVARSLGDVTVERLGYQVHGGKETG